MMRLERLTKVHITSHVMPVNKKTTRWNCKIQAKKPVPYTTKQVV